MKFISIQEKIIVSGVFVTLFISTALYFILNFSIESNLSNLEDSGVRKNLLRIDNGLHNHFEYLYQKSADWANWDATYEFMDSKGADYFAEYVDENLIAQSIANLQVDLIAYLDNEKELFYHVGYDYRKGEIYKINDESLEKIEEISERFPKDSNTNFFQGYINLEHDVPMLFVAQKILKSDGSGPSNGLLVMAAYIDERVINTLTDYAVFPVYIQNMNDHDMSANFVMAKKHLLANNPDFIYHTPDNNYGYLLYRDIWGDPAFMVRVNIPRELAKKYLQTVNYSLLGVFAGGLLLSFMGYLFIKKYALSPLRRLHQVLSEIAKGNKSVDLKFDIQGNNEITYLAQELKKMIENLSQAEAGLLVKNDELEKINKLMIGRELKMIELKEELIKLKSKIYSQNNGIY